MNDGKLRTTNERTISVDEIKDLLITYNIGKKPLAKLLGWGETTIIRYIEGDIPTQEYSEKLKLLQSDPNYYYKLLVDNEDKLTHVAFKKSKRAVLDVLTKSKIKLVAQYIINKANGEITARMIQVVLFYSQAVSLAMYDKPLFDTECQITYNAMPYLSLYDNMRKNGVRVIEVDEKALNPQEKDIIDHVFETFQWFGPKAIKVINGNERQEHPLESYRLSGKIIPRDVLKQAYTEIFDRYQIKKPADFQLYIQARMTELLIQKRNLVG